MTKRSDHERRDGSRRWLGSTEEKTSTRDGDRRLGQRREKAKKKKKK